MENVIEENEMGNLATECEKKDEIKSVFTSKKNLISLLLLSAKILIALFKRSKNQD